MGADPARIGWCPTDFPGIFHPAWQIITKATIEVTGAPSLKVDQEEIDLGDMKFNQVADVSFQLTNVGDQTLRFTKDPYIEVVEGC